MGTDDKVDASPGVITPYLRLDVLLAEYADSLHGALGHFVNLYPDWIARDCDFDLTSDVDFVFITDIELADRDAQQVHPVHTQLLRRDFGASSTSSAPSLSVPSYGGSRPHSGGKATQRISGSPSFKPGSRLSHRLSSARTDDKLSPGAYERGLIASSRRQLFARPRNYNSEGFQLPLPTPGAANLASSDLSPACFVCGSVCGRVCGVPHSPGMDIFLQLDRELLNASAAALPVAWAWDPRLAGHASASALATTVRTIGSASDDVVEALMAVTERQELADTIILAATVGLVRNRCGRGVVSTEDLLAEVAISIGECRRDGVPTTGRHLINVILDRAWDRARMLCQSARGIAVVGSTHVERLVVDEGDVERVALNRVALLEFRQRLQAGVGTSPAAVRAWNSAVELVDVPHKSRVQLDRWKYARSQLRRHGSPDLAA